jgi:intein/homing endonuclease
VNQKALREDFFEEWSPEMAYILGLLAADGSLSKNVRGGCYVELFVADRVLVGFLKSALRATQKVARRAGRKSHHKPLYRIQIGSKKIFMSLVRRGLSPRKSKTLLFPDMPDTVLAHFVRGYFDGDGNVYFRSHFAKDRAAYRWVFSSRFTSGSKEFLQRLHDILKSHGVRGGRIAVKERGYDLVLSHRDSIALYKFMYHNAGRTFLDRKRRIFEKALRELKMRE